jgi:hypothetical protein
VNLLETLALHIAGFAVITPPSFAIEIVGFFTKVTVSAWLGTAISDAETANVTTKVATNFSLFNLFYIPLGKLAKPQSLSQ